MTSNKEKAMGIFYISFQNGEKAVISLTSGILTGFTQAWLTKGGLLGLLSIPLFVIFNKYVV